MKETGNFLFSHLKRAAWPLYLSLLVIVVFTPNNGDSGNLFGLLRIEGMLEQFLNIFLLVPLALLILFSESRILTRYLWIWGPTVSTIIEIIQRYIPGRVSDWMDLAMNSLGYFLTIILFTRLKSTN